MSAQRSFYLNCKFMLLMLVSGIRYETSHKTSTEERINVAEKCFSVKHLAKTFLGISGPLSWIIYRDFTNNNSQEKTCIIHVSLFWDSVLYVNALCSVCLLICACVSVCVLVITSNRLLVFLNIQSGTCEIKLFYFSTYCTRIPFIISSEG